MPSFTEDIYCELRVNLVGRRDTGGYERRSTVLLRLMGANFDKVHLVACIRFHCLGNTRRTWLLPQPAVNCARYSRARR